VDLLEWAISLPTLHEVIQTTSWKSPLEYRISLNWLATIFRNQYLELMYSKNVGPRFCCCLSFISPRIWNAQAPPTLPENGPQVADRLREMFGYYMRMIRSTSSWFKTCRWVPARSQLACIMMVTNYSAIMVKVTIKENVADSALKKGDVVVIDPVTIHSTWFPPSFKINFTSRDAERHHEKEPTTWLKIK